MRVRFTWKEWKSRWNKENRGFDFRTAARVFDDPHAVYQEDRIDRGEERLHAIGFVPSYGLILVAYTVEENEEEEHIHIISARYAERWEKHDYYDAMGHH